MERGASHLETWKYLVVMVIHLVLVSSQCIKCETVKGITSALVSMEHFECVVGFFAKCLRGVYKYCLLIATAALATHYRNKLTFHYEHQMSVNHYKVVFISQRNGNG